MKTLPIVILSMVLGCPAIYGGLINKPSNGEQNAAIRRQQTAVSALQARGAELMWDRTGVPSSIRNDRSGGLLLVNDAGQNSKFNAKQWQNAGCSVLKSCADVFRIRNADQEFAGLQAEADMLGNHHVRLTQMSQGLEVIGGQLIVHFDKQGQAYQVNGSYVPDVAVNLKAALTPEEAATNAQKDLQAKKEPDSALKSQPRLVIYAHDVMPQLAYEVKAGTWFFYVNADSGEVLYSYNVMKNLTFPGKGMEVTVHGDRMFSQVKAGDPIDADVPGYQNADGYFLYSPSKHFIVYNEDDAGNYKTDSSNWCNRITREWGDSDPAAISVAENMAIVDDYFSTHFQRHGWNNSNGVVQANIHSKTASSGGGGYALFAAVNCTDTNVGYSCGSLDICAHEYTHSVVSSVERLNLTGNTGGDINESFADIFGCCVEFWAQPDNRTNYPNYAFGTADWYISEDFPEPPFSMSWPWRLPDGFMPQNFMFYLLCEGGQGDNRGIPYDVKGVGIKWAEKIAYLALDYCEPSTDYAKARGAWLFAARDLEPEYQKSNPGLSLVESVRQAWKAIGISALSFTCPGSLSFKGTEGGPFVAIDNNSAIPQTQYTLEIKNSDPIDLAWEITTDAPWIQVLPTLKGSVPGGGSTQISISLNVKPYTMGPGEDLKTLTFKCPAEKFTSSTSLRLSIVDKKEAGIVVTQIAAGRHHGLVRKSNGSVWAWGRNDYGQIGNGVKKPLTGSYYDLGVLPVPVNTLANVKAIAAKDFNSLALTFAGEVWAWGSGSSGKLGNGQLQATPLPAKANFPAQVRLTAIASGPYHALALQDTGMMWGWGSNWRWQLGQKPAHTNEDQPLPIQVQILPGAVKLQGGSENSMALMQDGTVWAWGGNYHGKLGLGLLSDSDSALPMPIPNFTDVADIQAGMSHNLALKNDGTVWAWGDNKTDQLTGNTYASTNRPMQIPGLAGVKAIGAGEGHGLAVKIDGSVAGWGDGRYEQLGKNAVGLAPAPVEIPGLEDIVAVDGGLDFSLALDADGAVWAWGNNKYNQLGVASISSAVTPFKIPAFIPTPGSPSLVQASDGDYPDKVRITWNKAGAVDGYVIWRAKQNDSRLATAIGTTSQLFFNDPSPQTGVPYFYWVTGARGNLFGPFSPSDSGYAWPTVTGVSASEGTFPNRVQITWNPVGSGGVVWAYSVWKSLSRDINAPKTKIGETTGTQWSDNNAKPGIRAWYWVKVVRWQGLGQCSEPDSGYAKMTTTGVSVEPQDNVAFYGFKSGPFELLGGNVDWVSPIAWFTIDNHQKPSGRPPRPVRSGWKATAQANWFSINPSNGVAVLGVLDYIEITPSPAAKQLPMGDYYDNITLEYTYGGQTMVETRGVELHVLGINYVDANSATPQPPYGSWATAAQTIQQAIDVTLPGNIILVADGIYEENVVVDFAGKLPVTIQSANGAQNCVIDGGGQGRCLEATGVAVNGFTLENGNIGHRRDGGGAWLADSKLVNCRVQYNTAREGGGVFMTSGEVNNCLVVNNVADDYSGGMYVDAGTVNNCTVANNQHLSWGWGFDFGGGKPVMVNNTIIWGNQGTPDPLSPAQQRVFNHCCLPINMPFGNKCISGSPWFFKGPEGDYYLRQPPCQTLKKSPCVDAGDGKGTWMLTTRTDGVADTGQRDIGYHYPANTGPYDDYVLIPIGGGGAYEQY